MKLGIKMGLLFSCIMIIAILLFSSYTMQLSANGRATYSDLRFKNMSLSITRYLEQDFSMKKLTLEDLTNNHSLMSALNQFVRDDSADAKMAGLSRTAALQQLYQSSLADQYYRVSFFTDDGLYITNLADKNEDAELIRERLLGLAELKKNVPGGDESAIGSVVEDDIVLLPPQEDIFNSRGSVIVYGVMKTIVYHDAVIGYMTIINECSFLNNVLTFLDNTEELSVELVFDSGILLYSSTGEKASYSPDIPTDEIYLWTDAEDGTQTDVWHSYIPSLGLHLYISQNNSLQIRSDSVMRRNILQRALIIMIPALLVITMASFGLTRSMTRLTKKVRQISPDVLHLSAPECVKILTETVTSPADHETYMLENAYNDMMLRLRESTLHELTLRESTLQAQLNALQAQINPHFIYNTLNIISAKSMESGNFDVIEICDQFASMLRYSTDTRRRAATLADEIENVRNYLLLAKARYEENLEFVIDVPEELQAVNIPKLTLQPLVENALNHGYDGRNVLRRLSITGQADEGEILLRIRDNGTGFSPEMLSALQKRIAEIYDGKGSIEDLGGHLGVLNTCLRIYYHSNGRMRMTIENDNGAVVTLRMPVDG